MKKQFLAIFLLMAVLLSACAPKDTRLNTPYGALDYPKEWREALVVTDREEEGLFAKTFSAQFASARYDLFTVSFGESAGGTLYGYIIAEGEKIPIYIECFLLPEEHGLSEEEESRFYQMLDGINGVVASLQALPYSEE